MIVKIHSSKLHLTKIKTNEKLCQNNSLILVKHTENLYMTLLLYFFFFFLKLHSHDEVRHKTQTKKPVWFSTDLILPFHEEDIVKELLFPNNLFGCTLKCSLNIALSAILRNCSSPQRFSGLSFKDLILTETKIPINHSVNAFSF